MNRRDSLAVQGMSAHSSGVGAVDTLIDGVRVGDNLVFVVRDGVEVDWLVDRFVAVSNSDRLIVADASGRHVRADHGVVLDWSASGRRHRVAAAQARAALADADERVGEDARFVFDSLTELADAWGTQAALDLFMWACPRLYRRHSVALWVVHGDRHDDGFLRRLTEITQVVVEVRESGGELVLEVVKADGRPRSVQGRALEARLVDDDLVDARPIGVARQRLGEWLRELRSQRGVGQAELARRVGISPSALSQAERGVGRVSAETLMRVWEELGVPLGPGHPAERGYRVTRRGGQHTSTLAAGVSGRQLSDDPAATIWQLTVAPRASGRNPIFPVKTPELVSVLRGVLQLEVEGRMETVHEGDTLIASDAAITAWANPADTPAEAMWVIAD
jgi:transcriptional regulator with XRE-family HTH domain